MVSLNELPAAAMALVVGGIMLGAGGLAMSQFFTSVSDSSGTNTTTELAVLNVSSGIGNMGQQLPTVGVIIGVSLIIAVVVGAFAGGLRKERM